MTLPRRRLIRTAFGTLCAIIVTAALVYHWFIETRSALPEQADAVIVLAGGEGERLPVAVALMKSGLAPVLVVSLGGEYWTPEEAWRAVNDVCVDTRITFGRECLRTIPDSTRGEGIAFSLLAKQRNWSRLIIVTSDYHLFRSMMWFERCFNGQVFGAAAPSERSMPLIIHELLGVVAQTTFQRSCGI